MDIEKQIKYNSRSLFCSKVMYKLHLNSLGRLASKKRIADSMKYIESQIPSSLEKKYDCGTEKIPACDQMVFMLWFQGEEKMPVIVRKCFESVGKNLKGRKFVLLTEENYREYAQLPEMIQKKIDEKKITMTAASDIIRACVLKKYGGTWIDATAFLSAAPEDSYFEKNFYCPCGFTGEKQKEWKYLFKDSNGWTIWFMGTDKKNYCLYDFIVSAYTEYFEKNEKLIDYFFTDMLISIFYSRNSQFRNDVLSLEPNNVNAYSLFSKMNSSVCRQTLSQVNDILKSGFVHKLTYKKNLDFENAGENFSNLFIRNY